MMSVYGGPPQGLRRYTAFCAWPDTPKGETDEQVDVDAADIVEARTKAKAILSADYDPGGRIIHVEERFGLYI